MKIWPKCISPSLAMAFLIQKIQKVIWPKFHQYFDEKPSHFGINRDSSNSGWQFRTKQNALHPNLYMAFFILKIEKAIWSKFHSPIALLKKILFKSFYFSFYEKLLIPTPPRKTFCRLKKNFSLLTKHLTPHLCYRSLYNKFFYNCN
jgi:hypothetical protein